MKWIIISAIAIILILVIIGLRLRSFSNNLGFDFSITKFTFSSLLQGQIGMTMDLKLDNKSSTNLRIGKIYLEIYFKGKLIAETPVVIGDNLIEANKTSVIKGFQINTFINKETGEIISLFYSKKPIDLEIYTKFSLFGVPISFLPRIPYTYNSY